MSSSAIFYSYPLHPSHLPLRTRTTILMPQHHILTPYKPVSPSPLRTSKNANVMSNPLTTKSQGTQPVVDGPQQFSQHSNLPPSDVPSKPFFFVGSTANDVLDQDRPSRTSQFQYESRARSSSPSVQLQSHMVANRSSRKKVVLDRLRHKRDDARFERSGEQVLRMDWLNERKAWEQEMLQSGAEYEDRNMEDEDMTEAQAQQAPDEAMSPTEDKELEELVSYFEQSVDDDDEFDDGGEDYDALFMEVWDKESEQKDRNNSVNTIDVEMT